MIIGKCNEIDSKCGNFSDGHELSISRLNTVA